MFTRSNRLSESSRVVAVVRHGLSVPAKHWRLIALKPREVGGLTSQPGRCAVVVSKKTAKLAVTRNRLKRRTREAVMSLGLPMDTWVVIFPRLSALTCPHQELIDDYERWRQSWLKK